MQKSTAIPNLARYNRTLSTTTSGVLEESIVFIWLGGRDIASQQNSDDEGVDCNDTSHDNGNQRLGNTLSATSLVFLQTAPTFIIRSGLKVPTPEIPMPDFAVPYAAPAPAGSELQSLSTFCPSPTSEYHLPKLSCISYQLVGESRYILRKLCRPAFYISI